MKEDQTESIYASGGVQNRKTSSGTAMSSKSSPTKLNKDQKQKELQSSVEDLMKVNAEMTREVEELNKENQVLKLTLTALVEKIAENAKIKSIKIPPEINNANVAKIPMNSLLKLTETLTADTYKSETLEFRVEEMETRITHLNAELAKLIQSRLHIENSLEKIVKDGTNLEDIRAKAVELIREIKCDNLFTFLDSLSQEKKTETRTDVVQESSAAKKHTPRTITVLLKDESLNLTPPEKKMPGETHIKNMHQDLRRYLTQQLSLPKGNGADWRMMGERVGIPPETITQWKQWKVEMPMQYVFQAWSQSPGATLRLLHRHLVSPQMKCTLLAKRISDFYHVD